MRLALIRDALKPTKHTSSFDGGLDVSMTSVTSSRVPNSSVSKRRIALDEQVRSKVLSEYGLRIKKFGEELNNSD